MLARAGHSAKVLIADGNYPASSARGPQSRLVSLNLSPGVVGCGPVLETLAASIPIEAINTMGMPDDDPFKLDHDPPIWDEYRRILGAAQLDIQLSPIDRWEFYDAVASRDHVLTIQTAEQSLWANLLLTVGVRQAGE